MVKKFDNVEFNEKKFLEISNESISNSEMGMIESEVLRNLLLDNHHEIITHNGRFHADEVFSIALILVLRSSWMNLKCKESNIIDKVVKLSVNDIINKVIRVPNGLEPTSQTDMSVYESCLVLDIKNGHFDHHHSDPNKIPTFGEYKLATIGSLWRAIGHSFDVGESEYNVFDRMWENFILPISLQDQYGPNKYKSPISEIISNINGYSPYEFDFIVYNAFCDSDGKLNVDIQDLRFYEAVMMAFKIIRMQIINEQNFVKSLNSIYNTKGICLTSEGPVPMCVVHTGEGIEKEPKLKLEALKYVKVDGKTPVLLINEWPSDRDGTFRIICVDSEKVHLDPELLNNPAPGQKFVHNGLFMITFETLESLYEFINKCELDEENHILKYNR